MRAITLRVVFDSRSQNVVNSARSFMQNLLTRRGDLRKIVDDQERLFETDKLVRSSAQQPAKGGQLHVVLLERAIGKKERHSLMRTNLDERAFAAPHGDVAILYRLFDFLFVCPGQHTGQGPSPRYLCPRLQVFQPLALDFMEASRKES
jgi:hypothetical protein